MAIDNSGRRLVEPPALPREEATESRRRRIQFEFDAAAYDRLVRLQEKTENATKAEVIRSALRLYEWLVEKAEAGKSITLVKESEETEGPIDLRLIIPLAGE